MKKNKSKLLQFVIDNRATLILIGIIGLAVLFRLFQLNNLPPGLHPDEAANGLDIVQRINHHDWRVIYNTNGPREALFFYFQAIFVLILGNTILALRMAPALFGILTVFMVYLYTKDWFGRRTALLAAFLIAVNPWVNTISRDGFRASMVPLVIATVAYLGGRAYRTSKTWYFVGAGLVMGLGFYTYTAFAMFSLVPLGGLLYIGLTRRDWLAKNVKNLIIATAIFLITLTPLIYTIVKNPGDSTARAGGTSFLNSQLNDGKPIQTLIQSTGKTLLQFNYQGDANSRHNLPGEPLLNTFVGIMLILGLLVAFSRITRVKYAALLAMFFTMMLPSMLTAEGLPHALRSIGTAASVFTLSAVGINYLLTRWYKTFPINAPARTTGAISIGILLALTALVGWQQYFVAWAQDPLTYSAYSENMVQIGNYLIANPAKTTGTNYLIAGGYESTPTQYLAYSKSEYSLLNINELQSLSLTTQKQLFVYPQSSDSQKITELLQAKYPTGQLTPHYSSFNNKLLFYSYLVNQ